MRVGTDAGLVEIEYRSEYAPGESWPSFPTITSGPLCTLDGEPCGEDRAMELLTGRLGRDRAAFLLDREAAP